MTAPDLTAFDVILVNTSAGKDSQVMLDVVVALATSAGVRDRVVAVHCDLGAMEWAGTRDLAERQCAAYGVPLHVVRRRQGDLLAQVRHRRMWPSPGQRYCTSDQKRAPVRALITRLVAAWRDRHGGGRPCRVLNAMGLRAQESPGRKVCRICKGREKRPGGAGKHWGPVSTCRECHGSGRRATLVRDTAASNGRRDVYEWLPIHDLTTEDVWARIRASGVEHHRAYDLGMRRLSCVLCIFAPEEALLLAGFHNRALLANYVATEDEIGHAFKYDSKKRQPVRLRVIQDRLAGGEIPAPDAADSGCWGM